jgi:hypothetical protein
MVVSFSGLASGQSPNINQKNVSEIPRNGIQRRPKLTLQQAMKFAERFAKRKKIDLSSYFLQGARLVPWDGKEGSPEVHWSFHWVGADQPVGIEIWIDVSMEGTASRPFTM